jgi:hypothetical protein
VGGWPAGSLIDDDDTCDARSRRDKDRDGA